METRFFGITINKFRNINLKHKENLIMDLCYLPAY